MGRPPHRIVVFTIVDQEMQNRGPNGFDLRSLSEWLKDPALSEEQDLSYSIDETS
jgi:hypothetical protein